MKAFLRYGNLAASTRQRLLQYRPRLEEAGIELAAKTLLSNDYVEGVGTNARRGFAQTLNAYRDRLHQVRRSTDADVVWTYMELFPYVPAQLERLVTRSTVPSIVDYDDAWFHRYDQHGRASVRWALGNKIGQVMADASLVVCGNEYIRHYADANGARTVVIPTVVDTDLYHPAETQADGLPVIGWIGSPTTSAYLEPIAPLLRRIVEEKLARVRIVGAAADAGLARHFECVDWSEEQELADLQSFDIGIMPLDDSIFARGKCGYKLIQYMACGTATVASPVGVNATIVRDGETGLHAASLGQWDYALRHLLSNADERDRMATAGRADAVALWSLSTHAPRFVKAVRSVAG